jgi:hypothetical protein
MGELQLAHAAVAAVGTYLSVPEIAKQAQDFVAAFTGHKGETIGTILGNAARDRVKNAEGVVGKAHFTLLNLNIPTQKVAMNIWQPLLESASLQEDETIQDRWAFLLANAADARRTRPVEPCYVDMLNHLSSREVRFLDSIYGEKTYPHTQLALNALHNQFRKAGLASDPAPDVPPIYSNRPVLTDADKARFNLMIDILTRERIIALGFGQREGPYEFTDLGYAFVKACQTPEAGAAALGA